MLFSCKYTTPIGDCLLAADEESLIGIWFEGQKYFCPVDEKLQPKPDNKVLRGAKVWLDSYFNGGKPGISGLKLKPSGSEFAKEVWKILCAIPYGEVMTYGEIARIIAAKTGKEKMSAQAVGGAVGRNPISIIIPCHRVIGVDNKLTGYAGGLDKKIWLLRHEGVNI